MWILLGLVGILVLLMVGFDLFVLLIVGCGCFSWLFCLLFGLVVCLLVCLVI